MSLVDSGATRLAEVRGAAVLGTEHVPFRLWLHRRDASASAKTRRRLGGGYLARPHRTPIKMTVKAFRKDSFAFLLKAEVLKS